MVTAVGCLVAASWAPSIPPAAAITVMVLGMVRIRPWSVGIAVVCLCACLAAQTLEGTAPVAAGEFRGTVQLVGDPSGSTPMVAVEVRTATGHLQLIATAATAARLSSLGAGDRVDVHGRTAPWRRRSGHIRGLLRVDRIDRVWPRTPPVAGIAAARELIERSADHLPAELRALHLGFVIGDDRGSDPAITADLRAAGLSHLSVVSGENLAFVMLVLAPLLRRLGLRRRLWLVAMVVLVFLAITRFEPSILRAAAMAAIAGWTMAIGRPSSGLRVLGLAVIALLLIDPLLVSSVGFRLSLAATTGIVVLARPLAARLPVPRRLAAAIALPVAAQVGVAPIAIPAFGPQPLLAIPANVLVEPAAAFVMMWGTTVGVVAGALGGQVATVLQWPVQLALRWTTGVARVVATLPPLRIGLVLLGSLVVLLGATALSPPGRRRRVLAIAVALMLLIGVLPAWRTPTAGTLQSVGSRVWVDPDGAAVLALDGRVRTADLLVLLHGRSVGRLDLLVRTSDAAAAIEAEVTLRSRLEVVRVITPGGPGAEQRPVTVTVGTLQVEVARHASGLRVVVTGGGEAEIIGDGG